MRLKSLRQQMEVEELSGFLLSLPENIGYFTELFLEGTCCLITPKTVSLFVQVLVYEEAEYYLDRKKIPFVSVVSRKFADLWRGDSVLAGFKKVGLEPEMPVGFFLKLRRFFPRTNFSVSQVPLMVRAVKDESEIFLIRKAGQITKKVFRRTRKGIKTGVKETEVVRILQSCLEEEGAQESFPTIAAVGQATFFPHAVPTSGRFSRQDWMVLDFGAKYCGYCSDCTRIIFSDKIDEESKRVYKVLSEAKRIAEKEAGPGVPAKSVDASGRNLLKKQGLARYFIHGIGHGLGLSVHEKPVLGPKSTDVLKEGMVITLEPAVYIPGWGGMRIEDTYLVTKGGLDNLTA